MIALHLRQCNLTLADKIRCLQCAGGKDTMHLKTNKKLSCCRQTVRCFVSLNISLSHSRLLEMRSAYVLVGISS